MSRNKTHQHTKTIDMETQRIRKSKNYLRSLFIKTQISFNQGQFGWTESFNATTVGGFTLTLDVKNSMSCISALAYVNGKCVGYVDTSRKAELVFNILRKIFRNEEKSFKDIEWNLEFQNPDFKWRHLEQEEELV